MEALIAFFLGLCLILVVGGLALALAVCWVTYIGCALVHELWEVLRR